MPRRNVPYPVEFRRQMVELARAGRTPEELSREFEPSAQAIRNWVAQADRHDLPSAGRLHQRQRAVKALATHTDDVPRRYARTLHTRPAADG